jgi:hypothetical protein
MISRQRIRSASPVEGSIPDQGYRVLGGVGLGLGSFERKRLHRRSHSAPTCLAASGLDGAPGTGSWDSSIGSAYFDRGGVDDRGMGVGIKIRSARADFSATLSNLGSLGDRADGGTPVRDRHPLHPRAWRESRATPYIGSRTEPWISQVLAASRSSSGARR